MNYYTPRNLKAWEHGHVGSLDMDSDTAIGLYQEIEKDRKDWYRPSEMAQRIGRTSQYIRDAFDNQQILGHKAKGGGSGQRLNYLIPKRSVLLYLLETANYTGDELIYRLERLVKSHCTSSQRRNLVQKLALERR